MPSQTTLIDPKKRRANGVLAGTHLKEALKRAKKVKPGGMRMHHDVDPVIVLMDKLGDLSGITVLNNFVLYAIYERPNRTAGGIELPDGIRQEDEYQGKAGLIVKVGPLVDVNADVRGCKLEPGTWIAVRPSDGWAIKLNGVVCRLIMETSIHMVIPAPDTVY